MPKTSQAPGLHRASIDKLHDLDAALELMYYGWRGMTPEADDYLAKQGRRARTIAFSTWWRAGPTPPSDR
nr:hypothetical protein [Bradyrhizobium diazoefficiens]